MEKKLQRPAKHGPYLPWGNETHEMISRYNSEDIYAYRQPPFSTRSYMLQPPGGVVARPLGVFEASWMCCGGDGPDWDLTDEFEMFLKDCQDQSDNRVSEVTHVSIRDPKSLRPSPRYRSIQSFHRQTWPNSFPPCWLPHAVYPPCLPLPLAPTHG